jgi:hypothetical protein
MPDVGLSLFLDRQMNFKNSDSSSQKPQEEKIQKTGVIYDLTHK